MSQPLSSAGGYSVGTGNSKITVIQANGLYTGSVANVSLANVTGIVNDLYELHVSSFGNDTTGNGAVYNPYKTIGKAVSVAASGYSIIVHPGGYYEDVTIANLSTISISAVDSGGRGPFTPAIYGNLTISGNSSSIAIKNVGVRDTLTHSASGTLYLSTLQLGTSGTLGTLNKSGTGYLAAQDCSFNLTSGANLTPVNITGNGSVLFSNVAIAALTIDNANASVSVTNGSTTLSTTLTTGTLNVFDCFMYSLTNSGTHAVTSNGGVLNLRNSTLVKPNLSAATVNLSAGTVFAYGDVFFDRANSNIGINAGTTVDFQALRVSNTVTTSTFAATAGTISLTPRSSAPSSPTAGMFAVADRTNWDPASKGTGAAYPVFYDGSVWTALY